MFVVLLPKVLFRPDPLLHEFRGREKLQVAAPTSGNSSSLSTELQNREFGLIRHGGSHPHTKLGSYVAGCRCAEANKLNLGGPTRNNREGTV